MALTVDQQNDLNRINAGNRASGINRDMNPDYYLWLHGGSSAFSKAPEYYLDDAQRESAQAQAERDAINRAAAAKVAADQAALAKSYADTQKAAGTTKGKSGATAGNQGSTKTAKSNTANSEKLKANAAAPKPTNKATIVKPAVAQSNKGVTKGSSNLAKVNRVINAKTAKATPVVVKPATVAKKVDAYHLNGFLNNNKLANDISKVVKNNQQINTNPTKILDSFKPTTPKKVTTSTPVHKTGNVYVDKTTAFLTGMNESLKNGLSYKNVVSGASSKLASADENVAGIIKLPVLNKEFVTKRDAFIASVPVVGKTLESKREVVQNKIYGSNLGTSGMGWLNDKYESVKNKPVTAAATVGAIYVSGAVAGAAIEGVTGVTELGLARTAASEALPGVVKTAAKFGANNLRKTVNGAMVLTVLKSAVQPVMAAAGTNVGLTQNRYTRAYGVNVDTKSPKDARPLMDFVSELAVAGAGYSKGTKIARDPISAIPGVRTIELAEVTGGESKNIRNINIGTGFGGSSKPIFSVSNGKVKAGLPEVKRDIFTAKNYDNAVRTPSVQFKTGKEFGKYEEIEISDPYNMKTSVNDFKTQLVNRGLKEGKDFKITMPGNPTSPTIQAFNKGGTDWNTQMFLKTVGEMDKFSGRITKEVTPAIKPTKPVTEAEQVTEIVKKISKDIKNLNVEHVTSSYESAVSGYSQSKPVIKPDKFEIHSVHIPENAKPIVKKTIMSTKGVKVYGSNAMKQQMGDYLSRPPQDLEVHVKDIKIFVDGFKAHANKGGLVEGKDYMVLGTGTDSPKLEFNIKGNWEKGVEVFSDSKFQHIEELNRGYKPDDVGTAYGFEELPNIKVEGVKVMSLQEQVGRKFAGSVALRGGDIKPYHGGRVKDVPALIEATVANHNTFGGNKADVARIVTQAKTSAIKYPDIINKESDLYSPITRYIVENGKIPTLKEVKEFNLKSRIGTEKDLLFRTEDINRIKQIESLVSGASKYGSVSRVTGSSVSAFINSVKNDNVTPGTSGSSYGGKSFGERAIPAVSSKATISLVNNFPGYVIGGSTNRRNPDNTGKSGNPWSSRGQITPPGKPSPSKPTPSKPTPSKPTPSKYDPSKPTPSKPTPRKYDPSNPTPSKPTPSKPTPSKYDPSKPDTSKPSTTPSKPSSGPSYNPRKWRRQQEESKVILKRKAKKEQEIQKQQKDIIKFTRKIQNRLGGLKSFMA
ncbi:MAG: hypothetical protein ACYDEF_03670 [Methanosarcina sp.]